MSQSSTASDSNIFLWTAGATTLGVVDVDKMEYEMIEGMGGIRLGESLPHASLSVDNGRRIVTITSMKGADSCYVSYWQRDNKHRVITRIIESIDSDSNI